MREIQQTVLAMITGNLRLVGKELTQFLIDPATPEGVLRTSARLGGKVREPHDGPQADIVDTVGHLSDELVKQLNACLKEAAGTAVKGRTKAGVFSSIFQISNANRSLGSLSALSPAQTIPQ
jgi:hypothetical protein